MKIPHESHRSLQLLPWQEQAHDVTINQILYWISQFLTTEREQPELLMKQSQFNTGVSI